MAFEGPIIVKGSGGLGRKSPSQDGIGGMIIPVPAASMDALAGELNKVYQFNSLSAAEELGVTSSFDSTNGILAWYHISEIFRLAPDAVLYVLFVSNALSISQICDLNHVDAHLKNFLMTEDDGDRIPVREVGIVRNPDTGTYAPTLDEGIDQDALDAAPKAQATIDWLLERGIYIGGVTLEGRQMAGTIADIFDATTLASENVKICIGQDPAIAALDPAYAKHAAVGSAVGMRLVRKVNEDLGSVQIDNPPISKIGNEAYPLTDRATSNWLSAALSSGDSVATFDPSDLNDLQLKGYVFAGGYEGYPGKFFNLGITCTDDQSDFGRDRFNHTWAKAARLIRRAVIPKMKSVILINEDGTIDAASIVPFRSLLNQAVSEMFAAGEVSAVTFDIDPLQNVLATGQITITQMEITPTGVAESITGTLGFNNPAN